MYLTEFPSSSSRIEVNFMVDTTISGQTASGLNVIERGFRASAVGHVWICCAHVCVNPRFGRAREPG